MCRKFINWDDLRMRLNRCVCFYMNEPYYVDTDSPELAFPNINLKTIIGNKHFKSISHEDPYLISDSPSLGYMNYSNQSFYLKRNPQRAQNQGLRTSNISPSPGGNWWYAQPFYDTLKGTYPTLDKAYKNIINGDLSCAFSRRFCLSRIDNLKIGVNFMDRIVGQYNKDKIFVFPSKESFYIENLLKKEGYL